MNDFKFKKAYGQNFLQDHNIITNIVKETKIKENSLVIEIGPGSGVLTKELAKVSQNVLAYEIDTRLEEVLDEIREKSGMVAFIPNGEMYDMGNTKGYVETFINKAK